MKRVHMFTDTIFAYTLELVFLRTFENGRKRVVKLLGENKERKGQEYRIMKALQGKVGIPRVVDYTEINFAHKNKVYSEMIAME